MSRLVVLLATAAISARIAAAQTVDASILGSVHDSVGAALANATVTAKNMATGVEWTVTTTSTGRFALLQLPLGGPYTVTARRIGSRPQSRSGYELTLGSRVVVDLVLGRAPTELEPVLVSGTASENRAPSMGANFRVGGSALVNLPAVNRNFIPLLNIVGFNQTTRQYTYTVNENFGVLQKGGNPYQIQLAVRYGF